MLQPGDCVPKLTQIVPGILVDRVSEWYQKNITSARFGVCIALIGTVKHNDHTGTNIQYDSTVESVDSLQIVPLLMVLLLPISSSQTSGTTWINLWRESRNCTTASEQDHAACAVAKMMSLCSIFLRYNLSTQAFELQVRYCSQMSNYYCLRLELSNSSILCVLNFLPVPCDLGLNHLLAPQMKRHK
jgi:hypothetical protein